MTPNILEYEDGRVKVTAQAYAIPEVKALIDKYDMSVEPYLSYLHAMTVPDSPYINLPEGEKVESIIYDVKQSLGEFDYECPLLQTAVDKFKRLYTTKMSLLADELGDEMDRIRAALRSNPIQMGGMEDNMKIRMSLLERIGKISKEYQNVRKQADEELKVATKGDHETGMY
jgi:hypothetical protein